MKRFEFVDDVRCEKWSVFRGFFKKLEDELFDTFGQTTARFGLERRRLFGALHVEQLSRRRRVKGGFAREQFVKHETKRVEIRAMIDRARVDLLGTHVLKSSDTLRVGLVHGLKHFRDAEVHDLHVAVLEDHDVFRLEITMNDRRLLTMRGGECSGDGRNDAYGFGPGLPSIFKQNVAQGSSFKKLEDHGELPVGFDAGQTADDVGMFEMRQDLHLVDEEFASRVAFCEFRMEDFDRHAAFGELFFALVNFAHAPFAHQTSDDVITELLHHASPIRRATYVRAPVSTYTICGRLCKRLIRPEKCRKKKRRRQLSCTMACKREMCLFMNQTRVVVGFVLAALLAMLPATGCEDWECGYGGPGCSNPLVAGLCEANVLVVGQEYRVVFGYGSDTGVSEAKLLNVVSSAPDILQVIPTPGSPDVNLDVGPRGPFDGNNGSNDGGMTLRPLAPGKAQVTISLEYWEKTRTMSFDVVDMANAPAGFMAMTATERFAKCIEVTASVP